MAEAKRMRTRTCIGCGAQSDKTRLLRIVRTGDGEVRFDEGGRVAGRGAYVCSGACLETAMKTRKLQKALRTGIDEQALAKVAADIEAAAAGKMG